MSDEVEERAHYFRVVTLVIDVGTDLLRRIFVKEINTDDVAAFFRQVRQKLHNMKGALNDSQKKKVMAEKPDVEGFDISLLATLLKSRVCSLTRPVRGWYKEPDDKDLSIAADILRLANIRNSDLVSHIPKARLEKEKYEEIWNNVETIFIRLGKHTDVTEEDLKRKFNYVQKLQVLDPNTLELLKKWFSEDLARMEHHLLNIEEKVNDQQQETMEQTAAIRELQEVVVAMRRDMASMAQQKQNEDESSAVGNQAEIPDTLTPWQRDVMLKFENVEKCLQRLNDSGRVKRSGQKETEGYKIEIFWSGKDKPTGTPKQVWQRKGGGVRETSMSKSSTKSDILEKAKKLYFPNGESPRGLLKSFMFDIRVFDRPMTENETVEDIYKKAEPKRKLQFYMITTPEPNNTAKDDTETDERAEKPNVAKKLEYNQPGLDDKNRDGSHLEAPTASNQAESSGNSEPNEQIEPGTQTVAESDQLDGTDQGMSEMSLTVDEDIASGSPDSG